MTATTAAPDLTRYRTFLRILAARGPNQPVSTNALHDDLHAAQITGPSVGACFQHATINGYLTTSGQTVRSTQPAARGRRVLAYRTTSKVRTA